MSGPIVRTGTTPEFWKNWDNIFGDKQGKAGAKSKKPAAAKAAAAKKSAKPAKTVAKKSSKKK